MTAKFANLSEKTINSKLKQTMCGMWVIFLSSFAKGSNIKACVKSSDGSSEDFTQAFICRILKDYA